MVAIPASFAARIAGRPADPSLAAAPDGDTWLARLPRLLEEYLERWNLRPEDGAWSGSNALVVPVRRGTGEEAALKLTWPHVEARHEHLALRSWNGRGAVRLLAAEPSDHALLLERLDATRPLTGESILDACEVVGELFRTLDRRALPQLDSVADVLAAWAPPEATPQVPQRLVQQAAALEPQLLGSAPARSLVHWDLHDGNVLAPLGPLRGGWLAIDPKPMAGEWAFAVAPIVWNRPDELARAYDFRTHARLRADIVTDAAGLDPDRVRAWTFVRLVRNAVWAAGFAPKSTAFLTRMIALAKAFAD